MLAATISVSVGAQDTLIAPRAKGSIKAPVTVYEMSDFQCPYCRTFATETFPTIEREFIVTGKVRWVFINFPLTQLHPNAVPAAEFAACAAKQGRFWPAHDRIYETQNQWAREKNPGPFFVSLIDPLGLKRDPMMSCLEGGKSRSEIRADAEGAARSGARSTPTFYIGGGLLVGAQPLPVFRQVLDSVWRAKVRKPAAK